MNRLSRLRVVIVLAALAVAGCETEVPVQKLPEMTFGHLPVLGLNVARIEVVSEYASPLAPPNVEHLLPTSPETALRRWVADRLQAKGATGSARFTISQAAVTETRLPRKKGLRAAFTKQQSERYDAEAAAMLEVFDDRGFRKAFASARVARSRSVREDATVNDRERTWYELVEDLMKDFDAEIDKNIHDFVGGFLM